MIAIAERPVDARRQGYGQVPALLLGGAGIFVVGAIVQLAELVAVGIIGVVLGLIGFLAAPAMAIARSIQDERDP